MDKQQASFDQEQLSTVIDVAIIMAEVLLNNNSHVDSTGELVSKKKKRKRKNKNKSHNSDGQDGGNSVQTETVNQVNCQQQQQQQKDVNQSENLKELSGKIQERVSVGTPKKRLVQQQQQQKPNEKEDYSRKRVKTEVFKERKQPKVVEFFSDDEQDCSRLPNQDFHHRSLKSHARDLLKVRESLPVYKNKDKILDHLQKNKVTVLIGETGSGKSTQIPQFLMPQNSKSIAVTQPRRVAAINLARRVSEEYGTKLGDKVGYSVRFDNVSHKNTKLKYLTDGMLLREMMMNSDLSQYSTIVIDEAHERTVLTDMLMGFLKELLIKRKDDSDFKVIIMSATLDAEKFSKFFFDCEILYVEGKMYPVQRLYLDKTADDIIDTTIKSIVQINQSEEEGDILTFLPGQEEIDKACSTLEKFAPLLPKEAPMLVPLPIYAALPPSQQLKVFEPVKKNQRKVILATNIAETSITVPGVRYVVDTGLRKVKVWRHQLGLSTLLTVPISQASATQRAGRAGRERSGKAFRLYTESDYFKLPKQTEPEIIRTDIAQSILMLKKLQVDDIVNWPWIEHPGQESLFAALNQLYSLKALNDSGRITTLGEQMAVLPVSPQLSTVLINAFKFNCLTAVIDIISCLNVQNLILNPPSERRDEVNEKRRQICSLGNKYGDLLMFKEILDYFMEINSAGERKRWCKEMFFNFRGFKNVLQIKSQISQYMKSLFGNSILADEENGDNDDNLFNDYSDNDEEDQAIIQYKRNNKPLDIEAILKSFLQGYIMNTALGYPDRSYRTVFSGHLISIHPSSLLFSRKCDAIMYTEFVYTTKGYARNVSLIDPEWLKDIAPHIFGSREAVQPSQ